MRKTGLFVAALASVVLCSCVMQNLQKNLASYVGQPLDVAIAHMGLPSGERTIAGHHVYVWTNQNQMVLPTYQTSTTTGYVGGQSFAATTGQMGSTVVQGECEITLEVNGENVITSWSYNGNPAGCSRYQ